MVWLATIFGVSTFDGHIWHTYTDADGLLEGEVRAIANKRLYRSTDRGDTWQAFETPSRTLALSPEFGQDRTMASTLYNGLSERVELHLSRDGGTQCEVIGSLPEGVSIQQLSLAPLFAQWQTLFAFARQGDQPVLYRSSDGGRNWAAVLTSSADIQQLVYAPDIEENRPIFLLAGETVYRSGDGGLTWQVFDLSAGIVPTALAISPNFAQDGLLFLGTADGRVVKMKTS